MLGRFGCFKIVQYTTEVTGRPTLKSHIKNERYQKQRKKHIVGAVILYPWALFKNSYLLLRATFDVVCGSLYEEGRNMS